MKYEIVCKNYTTSKKLEELIQKKFDKLSKFFDSETVIRINLKKEKDDFVFEATIFSDHTFRAEVKNSEDMYSNIETALDKIIRQIVKHKSKFDSKRMKEFTKSLNGLMPVEDDEEKPAKIVKTKTYNLKPMSVEEAKFQMELLGHNFFVFLNSDNDVVNVIYKREDGDVGLIEAVV
ncbi:MAG TPA: ribosome-associated translation inhibitor RaiA [Clostridia bacterium]